MASTGARQPNGPQDAESPFQGGAASVNPSGRQYPIALGRWRASITEVGAAVRTLTHDGVAVLDPFPLDSMCWGGHGQPLLPWPNRIDHGSYRFEGRAYELPINEQARDNAIHGLSRFLAWTLEHHEPTCCVLSLRLHPQPGYPFTLDLQLRYTLERDGLAVETTATNRSPTACPFGAGYHPYLTAGDAHIDASTLLLPAASLLPADDRGIPTGERLPVAGTAFDFRARRHLDATSLDTCFTDLERNAEGMSVIELGSDTLARTVSVWMDAAFDHVMVFSGDGFGPERRRRALAIEPMTCPPNAFATGRAAVLLPGAVHRNRWGVSAHRG